MVGVWLLAWMGSALASPTLTEVRLRHAPANANAQAPVWSPDGAQLGWEANDHDARRVALWLSTSGKAPQQLAPTRPPTPQLLAGFSTRDELGAVVHELAFAPSGRGWLSYTVSTGVRDYDLYLHGVGPLAAGPTADGSGAWSPDGQRLVFTSSRTGDGDLYLLDATALDASPRRLTSIDGHAEVSATWTPDGREVLFVGRHDTGTQILALNVVSGTVRPLTNGPGERLSPSVSPDGASVAFYQRAGDREAASLVIVPLAGGIPRSVAYPVVPGARGPAWVDANRLLIVRDDEAALSPLALVTRAGELSLVSSPLVGHSEVAITATGQVAVTARGLVTDADRSYRKLYVGAFKP